MSFLPQEVIAKKRDGEVLSAAEIGAFIAGFADGSVSHAQAAAFALLGFGFFTWNDNSDAQESLAELREIRVAITEGARKKNCRL